MPETLLKEKNMRYFPVFLDLARKTCLVVGAGRVGRRKIKTLLQCSAARINVVDPFVSSVDIPDAPETVRIFREDFSPRHLEGCDLVFACTSSPRVNDKVVNACQKKNIWCNVAERPDQGDFILPGVFSRENLIIAVSTCGCSPALTARIKRELQDIYGPQYALLTELLAGVRNILLSLDLPPDENREYFIKIVDSRIITLLKSGNRQEIADLLRDILPVRTHKQIQGLIDALL
ncbi:MAG: bifunctional precorrin-2 dehydrogenase/sirohydrochlorin ferrochelatase [Desulfonatronovibrio sp.]